MRRRRLSRSPATPLRTLVRATLVLLALAAVAACGDETALPPDSAVRDAVRDYLENRGGAMGFEDPTADEVVELTFQKVHDEVRPTEGGRQVVCADFTGPGGTPYDVDFYVDARRGEVVIEESVIHRIDGEDVLDASRRAELDESP